MSSPSDSSSALEAAVSKRTSKPQGSSHSLSLSTTSESAGRHCQESRYACPMVKKYGLLGANGQSCTGKGWPTIHRLREHLRRRHGPLITCPRCYEEFQYQHELKVHLKAQDVCAQKEEPARSRVRCTDEQMAEMKPKRQSDIKAEEQWNRIYKILFREDTVIPSPYVHVDDNHTNLIQTAELQLHIKTELAVELRALLVDVIPNEARFPGMRSQVKSFIDTAFDSGLVQEAVARVVDKHKRRRTSLDISKLGPDISNNADSSGKYHGTPSEKGQDSDAATSVLGNSRSLDAAGYNTSGQSQLPKQLATLPSNLLRQFPWTSSPLPDQCTSAALQYDDIAAEELNDNNPCQITKPLNDDCLGVDSEPSRWMTASYESVELEEFDSELVEWPEQTFFENSLLIVPNTAQAVSGKRRASKSPVQEEE